MKLFALGAAAGFGARVADALGRALDPHEEREFEDGEHKGRPLVGVRGEDVYVLQNLAGDARQSVDERFCRLLFFLATLRDAGAARLTAVVPYLAYSRKDRRTRPRDPLTTRYVAELLESTGIAAVMTLEVHALAAFENAFRCRTHALDTRRLFAARAAALVGAGDAVVASPDPGGVKRAQLFRETLERRLDRAVGSVWVDKRRSGGEVGGTRLVGEIEGATVLLVDDMIVTGGTLRRAARACREAGARAVHAFAAHALFPPGETALFADRALDRIVVTDTVRAEAPAAAGGRVEIVSAAPLVAAAIRCCHGEGSLVELLGGENP